MSKNKIYNISKNINDERKEIVSILKKSKNLDKYNDKLQDNIMAYIASQELKNGNAKPMVEYRNKKKLSK